MEKIWNLSHAMDRILKAGFLYLLVPELGTLEFIHVLVIKKKKKKEGGVFHPTQLWPSAPREQN